MTEGDKTDGKKFALAFLAASGSILYAIYNNIQNVPINIDSYYVICLMIAGAVISIIGFLAYLLIKGYLMEAQCTADIEYLNKWASWLYRCSLLVFTMLACFAVLLFFTFNAPSEIQNFVKMICSAIILLISLIIIILFISYIYLYLTKKIPNKTSSMNKCSLKKSDLAETILAMVIVIIWFLLLFCFLYFTPLQGHVEVDMESIHYKNDTQIPVLIQVTGPNTDLYAILYKELSGNLSNVSYIGPIEPIFLDLESGLEERKIVSNDILLGSYLGNGKYTVFINTTNLTMGYYELMCLRKNFYEETCESKGFYLLNRS